MFLDPCCLVEMYLYRMKSPSKASLPTYYQTYFDSHPSDDLMLSLRNQYDVISALSSSIPAGKELFSYAPGKWTIREIIGHCMDTERIFSYRILRLSRKDDTALPGFDENAYIANFDFNRFTLDSLCKEWLTIRRSTISLLERLEDEALDFTGTANGVSVSARMIAFFSYAHAAHHLRIINERYL